jgi:hypothetical protein
VPETHHRHGKEVSFLRETQLTLLRFLFAIRAQKRPTTIPVSLISVIMQFHAENISAGSQARREYGRRLVFLLSAALNF